MVDGEGGVQDEGEGTLRVEMYFVLHYRLSASPRFLIICVHVSVIRLRLRIVTQVVNLRCGTKTSCAPSLGTFTERIILFQRETGAAGAALRNTYNVSSEL